MASNGKVRPEQITRAKKLLQNLPERDERKTREEAAELLEKDFRKALGKGYNPKQISAILKNEGIIIPAYLVKKFLTEENSTPKPVYKDELEKSVSNGQFTITPDTPDEEL
jgi:hypothetical protein